MVLVTCALYLRPSKRKWQHSSLEHHQSPQPEAKTNYLQTGLRSTDFLCQVHQVKESLQIILVKKVKKLSMQRLKKGLTSKDLSTKVLWLLPQTSKPNRFNKLSMILTMQWKYKIKTSWVQHKAQRILIRNKVNRKSWNWLQSSVLIQPLRK